jgi:hypothetical protein
MGLSPRITTILRKSSSSPAAAEPARTVNADKAGNAVSLAAVADAGGKLGHELRAEAALDLFHLAALAAHRLADLLADLVPQAFGTRCGEGLQLQARPLQVHGYCHHPLGGLLDLKPQLKPVPGCNEQGTEIHVAVPGADL